MRSVPKCRTDLNSLLVIKCSSANNTDFGGLRIDLNNNFIVAESIIHSISRATFLTIVGTDNNLCLINHVAITLKEILTARIIARRNVRGGMTDNLLSSFLMRVAKFHAEYVAQYIEKLNCPTEQKLRLLDAVVQTILDRSIEKGGKRCKISMN